MDLSLLVITKGLTKTGDDYEVKTAHVELAERMRKQSTDQPNANKSYDSSSKMPPSPETVTTSLANSPVEMNLIELSANTAREGKLNFIVNQLQMLLNWRSFLGGCGRSAKSVKAPFTRMCFALVEIARSSIGGRRRRKTWRRPRLN
ncbi:unnamed protein product [Cuscuta campestris]|uniref:DNA-directed DNA polymerase n=1 Tax=Cuscuta campestris TaxID=132261 RepID=A0A484MQE1_9ASTE|nr:unnamed protein product [Cuscuta campestris]